MTSTRYGEGEGVIKLSTLKVTIQNKYDTYCITKTALLLSVLEIVLLSNSDFERERNCDILFTPPRFERYIHIAVYVLIVITICFK